MRRLEAADAGIGVASIRNLLENVGGIRCVVAVVHFHRHARRRDTADRQMTGVSQYRMGELDVARGERIGAAGGAEIRHRIIGRIERVGAGILEACDRGLGVAGQAAVTNPDRRILARGVVAFDRLAFGGNVKPFVELLGLVDDRPDRLAHLT